MHHIEANILQGLSKKRKCQILRALHEELLTAQNANNTRQVRNDNDEEEDEKSEDEGGNTGEYGTSLNVTSSSSSTLYVPLSIPCDSSDHINASEVVGEENENDQEEEPSRTFEV
jgi:hypothetical protein